MSSTLSKTVRLATLALGAASSMAAAPAPRQRTVAPSPIPAKHMLFRVQGPGGRTVYLLGSVHLLTAGAAKLPVEVDSAFAHAGTVVFETSMDTVKMRGQELLVRGRYPAGTTLRSSLSPAGLAKADTLVRSYGLTLDQVNGFKPWLVSIITAQMAMQRAKFESQFGVEAQIDARARAGGKTLGALESVDFQLGMFDALSPADQEKMLVSGHSPDSAAAGLARVKDAWLTGDTAALDSLLNSTLADAPGIAAALVTDRNKNWIPKIETLLKGECDALVVVGAGHLVGKQGVVELLRAKGYKVDQL